MKCYAYLKFIANTIHTHKCTLYSIRSIALGNGMCYQLPCVCVRAHRKIFQQIKTKQITQTQRTETTITQSQARARDDQKNSSKNVCSLEMQTPLAIRVTHSYNKCDTIFECQTFCSATNCIRLLLQ